MVRSILSGQEKDKTLGEKHAIVIKVKQLFFQDQEES